MIANVTCETCSEVIGTLSKDEITDADIAKYRSMATCINGHAPLNPSESSAPQLLTPRQLRMSLVMSGIDPASIIAAIDTLPSPQKELALIEWEYALDFERSNDLVNSIGSALGLTSEQIDALWTLGSTL